jgi:dipeptidyl aminopeptidase/acylaminoacyl peptidase
MYRALIKEGKPATYYEIPGQGHGFKGTDTLEDYYAHLFKFLETIQ